MIKIYTILVLERERDKVIESLPGFLLCLESMENTSSHYTKCKVSGEPRDFGFLLKTKPHWFIELL